MIPLNLNAIRSQLEKGKIDVKFQEETDQLYFTMKLEKVEYPVFLRIIAESHILQIIAFIPCNFTPATVADTSRLLHLLNKELDAPGFGMDENSFVVFYRCMIPSKDQQLDTDLFTTHLNATEFIISNFGNLIASVAHGQLTFDEVVKKAKEAGAIQ